MITIYGTETCRWCKAALALAESKDLRAEYRGIDLNDQFYQELKALKPDVKTVPQIWINDKYIGGYEAFAKELENDEV